MYEQLDKTALNKDELLINPTFQNDAKIFLKDRAGYEEDDLPDNEAVYDAFLEHFRFQNTNEVTAVRDLMYAQNADTEDKKRMGRLMQTFDRMDSISDAGDVGQLAVDYAEGIVTSPSTLLGFVTGGAGKVASVSGVQGTKLALKALLKGAAQGAVVEGAVGAGGIAAQEQTRVETGLQEGIDTSNVLIGGVASAVPGAVVGGIAGRNRNIKEAAADRIKRFTQEKTAKDIDVAYERVRSQIKGDKELNATAKNIYDKLVIENSRVDAKTGKKKALRETIPELIDNGKELISPRETAEFGDAITLDQKHISNIATAAAQIVSKVGPIEGVVKGSAEDLQERFVSRMARALRSEQVTPDSLQGIMHKYNVSMDDIAAIYAAEVSEAGKILGQAGQLSRGVKAELLTELSEMDTILLENGQSVTSAARKRIQDEISPALNNVGSKVGGVLSNLAKARIGFMTVQFATTARNTTNGFMRNYIYGLDNLGSGLYNVVVNSAKNPTDEMLKAEAKRSIQLGKAQIKTAFDSFFLKDMFFGMKSVDAFALGKLMTDDKFGKSQIGRQLFRDMGDVAEQTGQEGGLLGVARKFNTLNTMSDNMFKRAIFAREINKSLIADGQGTLSDFLKEGKFSKLDNKIVGNAMTEALDFTYQTGNFKGRDGVANTISDSFINVFQNPAMSAFVPFPRYMVNQFRFWYEHAPVLGMVNMFGILNKAGGRKGQRGLLGTASDRGVIDFVVDSESVGKQITGFATLGAFMAMNKFNRDDTLPPYHYYDPTSKQVVDTRAALGPFTVFSLLADFTTEWFESGKPENLFDTRDPAKMRQLIEALGGGQFRPGTTGFDYADMLIERSAGGGTPEDDERVYRAMSQFAGDYVGGYFVGAGVLKDIVSTLDEDFRKTPNNQDVDLWKHFYKQATRAFPQTTDADSDGFMGYTGVGPQRDLLQNPKQLGGTRTVDPFLRQLTGLNFKEERRLVEEEYDRLNFDYYEISPTKIQGNSDLSNKSKGIMAELVHTKIASYIADESYKNLPTDLHKKINLRTVVNQARSEARSRVLDPSSVGTAQDFEPIAKATLDALGNEKVRQILYRFKQETGFDIDDPKVREMYPYPYQFALAISDR